MVNKVPFDKVVSLPSIPTVMGRVSAVANDPNSSIADLTKAIEIDQAVAARALRITNSAAFGLYSRVTSLHQACALLGMRMVRNVVLQTSLMEQYKRLQGIPDFDLGAFWRHTMLVAATARALCQSLPPHPGLEPEECYTAGLLHDIGVLLLLESQTDAYLEARRKARSEGIAELEAEVSTFGFDHAQIGAFLAQNWGYPEKIRAAIRGHHAPPLNEPHEDIAVLVAASNSLVEAVEVGRSSLGLEELDPRVYSLLKLPAAEVEGLVAGVLALLPTLKGVNS